MAAADHPHLVPAGRELQQQRGGEQFDVAVARRVQAEPALKPSGHLAEVRQVQHGLPERPQQRRHRADGREPVPLHIRDQGPHPVRARPHVVKVAADQRAALSGPVERGAVHRPDGGGQRGQHGELGGLGDGADPHQAADVAAADPGDHHTQGPDEGHGPGVAPGEAARTDQRQLHHDQDGAGQDRRTGHPVGQRGQRRHGRVVGAELDIARGERLGGYQDGEQDHGKGAQPQWRARHPQLAGTPGPVRPARAKDAHNSTVVAGDAPRRAKGKPLRGRNSSIRFLNLQPKPRRLGADTLEGAERCLSAVSTTPCSTSAMSPAPSSSTPTPSASRSASRSPAAPPS